MYCAILANSDFCACPGAVDIFSTNLSGGEGVTEGYIRNHGWARYISTVIALRST